MTKEEVKEEIIKQCEGLGLDETLALAICEVESNFDINAIRYEPTFRYSINLQYYGRLFRISQDTEKAFQAMSYGPMQVMGLVMRELGFKGHFVDLIKNQKPSIHYALKKLKLLTNKYENELHVISAYNAGSIKKIGNKFSNQEYVDKVTKVLARIRIFP